MALKLRSQQCKHIHTGSAQCG